MSNTLPVKSDDLYTRIANRTGLLRADVIRAADGLNWGHGGRPFRDDWAFTQLLKECQRIVTEQQKLVSEMAYIQEAADALGWED